LESTWGAEKKGGGATRVTAGSLFVQRKEYRPRWGVLGGAKSSHHGEIKGRKINGKVVVLDHLFLGKSLVKSGGMK
jgi:hypothetical protein